MSITILPNSKWQPSVLHLLPFSPNDAGASSNNTPLSNGGGPPTASYIQEEARGFPALAISQQDREKIRSKSAVGHGTLSKKKSSQYARPQTQTMAGKEREHNLHTQRRAKSDYGSLSDRKQETVKFSINDINEQILGRSHYPYGEKNSDSPDSGSHRADISDSRLKPLPKPAFRNREVRWPNARFWRSSCISPGELELQKHKNHLDIQTPTMRRPKRVKLNVKDLPRCKTPVGENDPDKLNMKHVIAFLQSNADVKYDDRKKKKISKRSSKNDNNSNNIENYNIESEEVNDNKSISEKAGKGAKNHNSQHISHVMSHDDTATLSASINRRHTQTSKFDVPTVADVSIDNYATQDDSQINNAISVSSPIHPLTSPHRSNLRQTDESKPLVYLDKQSRPAFYDGVRPKSLGFLHEKTDFRLPANLRHIRATVNDSKSFRLHRFLSLVSNTSGSENVTSMSKAFRQSHPQNNDGHQTTRSSLSRSLMRSSSRGTRLESKVESRARSETRRSNSEASRYHLSNDPTGKEESSSRHHSSRSRRVKSQESHYKKDTLSHVENKNKVICLPVAPVDVDSDDDYNPLPSVPGRLDRQNLVLSAQGRAIIAKHFPQTTTTTMVKFGKTTNGMRPHSVKDVVRWAEQKPHNGESFIDSIQRPHSMKNIKVDYASAGDNRKTTEATAPTLAIEGNNNFKSSTNNNNKDSISNYNNKNNSSSNNNSPQMSPHGTEWGHNISSEAIAGDAPSFGGEDGASDSLPGGGGGADNQQHNNGHSSPSRSRAGKVSNRSTTSKSNSSTTSANKSKAGDGGGFIIFPTEVNDSDDDDDVEDKRARSNNNNMTALLGNNPPDSASTSTPGSSNTSPKHHGARTKRSLSSPPVPGDPVKLTLRKERTLTRESTYMVDMGGNSPTRSSRKTGSVSDTFNTKS